MPTVKIYTFELSGHCRLLDRVAEHVGVKVQKEYIDVIKGENKSE